MKYYITVDGGTTNTRVTLERTGMRSKPFAFPLARVQALTIRTPFPPRFATRSLRCYKNFA